MSVRVWSTWSWDPREAWWFLFAAEWQRIGWAVHCERRYAQVARDERLAAQWAAV